MMNSDFQNEKGVYPARKKDGSIYYRASFTYNRKHISLGSFPTAKLAHAAYLQASELMHSTLSVFDYPESATLSFEKWVVLVNYRDNRIYLTNPIYIRKKYFSYFLDLHTELKFSIDDLFYYSSHKIMRRSGHFFVADYGMQVTILSRYKIKNYGVRGRDYLLLNQDPYDFRYENIQIINFYQGVLHTTHYKKECYKAVLHLKGNFTVGIFPDALTAAIAYNKAVDIVRANGVKKNLKQNYTEGISPSVYAEIYSKINIPEKIRNYRAE